MRLSKEEFCRYVDDYEKMFNKESEILEILDCSVEWGPSKWLGAYYDLLSDMCEFSEEDIKYGTWLDYYCYELDFGKNYEEGKITSEDGKNIPLRNSEDLWNIIASGV